MSDKVVQGNDSEVINIPGVEEWTLTSLRYTCKMNKVKGYTKMNKEELKKAVQKILDKMGEDKNGIK